MAGWTWTIATMIALAGAWSAGSGMDDRPVIDPGVRAVVGGGTLRVLVELRVPRKDPVALRNAQDEALRRLAGTGARGPRGTLAHLRVYSGLREDTRRA